MIKTLQQALKMDREKFKVPRSVQQAIPIQRIWPDGVFQSGTKFSKTFRFSDINYAIASKEDKTEMFLDYSELLNALDSGAAAKITLNNRRINKEEFEEDLGFPWKRAGLRRCLPVYKLLSSYFPTSWHFRVDNSRSLRFLKLWWDKRKHIFGSLHSCFRHIPSVWFHYCRNVRHWRIAAGRYGR